MFARITNVIQINVYGKIFCACIGVCFVSSNAFQLKADIIHQLGYIFNLYTNKNFYSVDARIMDKLPNEMLVKIFSYFHPIYENLASHAVVCRKWMELIENSALLWKHIHLDDNRHSCPNMENEYKKVLCDCLVRFGRFVHCIRAEEETFFTGE